MMKVNALGRRGIIRMNKKENKTHLNFSKDPRDVVSTHVYSKVKNRRIRKDRA
jgi:hypothetical protein